ncbi:MAG: STAS domain-containing protein [Candidatus Wallbacteria bacterium]
MPNPPEQLTLGPGLPFTYEIKQNSAKTNDGAEEKYNEIILAGKLEFLSNPDIEKNFCELPAITEKKMVLNLQKISFVNSLGLNFLLNEYEKCGKTDHKLYLSNVGTYVKKVLTITKLDNVFKILNSPEECVKF